MEIEIPFNPIPCIPFPLARGRGGDLKEGLALLLNTLLFYSGRVRERLRFSYQKSSPSPLRERGVWGRGC